MNTLSHAQQNRQEFLYYFLGATMLLFILALSGLTVWYALPFSPSARITVGTIDNFPPSETPYRIAEQNAWLVNIEGQLLVFTPVATNPYFGYENGRGGCHFAWNNATSRFIDPCSGDNYALDGTLLRSTAPADAPLASHDLDQYAFMVRANGDIVVDLGEIILGAE